MDQSNAQPLIDQTVIAKNANLNAAIWAFGNGLASTTLVYYLALELDAGAAVVAWIIAAPKLAGLLRIFAPQLIAWIGNRKLFCLACYILSAVVLIFLPLLSVPGVLPSTASSLSALVVCWCVYHLLEYLGTVGLWAWYADIFPPEIRGRFVGTRQSWLTAGQLFGLLLASVTSFYFQKIYPVLPPWEIYCYLALIGANFLGLSVLPLREIPELTQRTKHKLFVTDYLTPLLDSRMHRLMVYGFCFSAANGISASLMGVYVYKALALPLIFTLSIPAIMRLGQSVISPTLGKYVDQAGCKKLMIVSQLLVSLGPLLYLFGFWGYVAANIVWIAYAGLNICLPVVILNSSETENAANNVAGYFAVTGFVYGIATILGGIIGDQFVASEMRGYSSEYTTYFVFAWLLRTLCVIPLFFLINDIPNQKDVIET